MQLSAINKGYINAVIHEPLFEILSNGIFIDLAQEDHVVHATALDIVTLPMVRLQQEKLEVNTQTTMLIKYNHGVSIYLIYYACVSFKTCIGTLLFVYK